VSGREITPEERDALATLAKGGRVIAILVPEGVDDDDVKELTRMVSGALDKLADDARKAASS